MEKLYIFLIRLFMLLPFALLAFQLIIFFYSFNFYFAFQFARDRIEFDKFLL